MYESMANGDLRMRNWIPISSSWKSQKSEILNCVTLRGGIMRLRSSGKLSTRLRINKATEYEVHVWCSLFSMKVTRRLVDRLR